MLIKCIGSIESVSHSKVTARFSTDRDSLRWSTNRFFMIALEVMSRNKAYMVRHVIKILPKFSRTMSVSSIREIMCSALERIRGCRWKMVLRRKWIQAPAPKCRSLTIPSVVDRVVASMWSEVLELYLKGMIDWGHHGFQEGVGTKTALEDLHSNILRYPYVYEFDLKNFFPSVSQSVVISIMRDMGIPAWVCHLLLLPVRRKPVLDLELEVPDYQRGGPSVRFASMYEKVNYKGESNYVLGKAGNIGVPMGLGYSPLLAMLVLCRVLKEWKTDSNLFITYADDGILLMNEKKEISRFIAICSKSGMIIDGGTSREFKFLGIKTDPLIGKVSSETRKGHRHVWDWIRIDSRYLKDPFYKYLIEFLGDPLFFSFERSYYN